MSSAYEPQSENHPERVPPNRVDPKRPLVVWGLLFGIFVVFYNLYAPPSPTPLHDELPPPPASSPWPFALPAVTLLGLAALFVRIRSRLPAAYRTGELRTLKAEATAAPGAPPPFEPIELKGKGEDRPVVLRIAEAGFHWSAEARLLKKEQWLDIDWDELKSFGQGIVSKPGVTFVLWIAIVGAFTLFYQLYPQGAWSGLLPNAIVIALVIVGALALAAGRRFFWHGTITLVTESHQLTFQSHQLDQSMREQIKALVKTRRPELVPESNTTGWRALHALFVRPFAELRRLFQSDESLMSFVRANAITTIDEETALAGALQYKLYAIWSGGLCALMPLSVGLALALWSQSAMSLAIGFFITWVVGLMIAARLMRTFARLSGMSFISS